MTLYAAKCFWPGVTEETLRDATERAGAADGSFRGAYLLPADELVLAFFAGESVASVKRAAEQARMPCERVMEAVWIAPSTRRREER